MKMTHVKTMIAAMADKIQDLEKDVKLKEYTINVLQRKLKERNGKTEDSNNWSKTYLD